ncbi:MAG: CbbQ/NirQ/NorQ C-terminal domain-containing protein, partial [Proteobacteria bacterium]|nr:CbbQ/NirQ/NorQ C-terminal domain-containing protein [Pseudomonadota bacterium]
VSYNPGYQNILKSLKPSTRQRFLAIEFDYPPPAIEAEVLTTETGVSAHIAGRLVALAGHIRKLKGRDLEEGASTRLLAYAASLIAAGMKIEEAITVALVEPLTDDAEVKRALGDLVVAVFG